MPARKIVCVFARFKTYSGAEHFCFRLAREGIRRGQQFILVTRHLPAELVEHVPEGVEVYQLEWAHRPTRFHFFESMCDVFYSPFLFRRIPTDSDTDVYWNDNTAASLFIDSFRRAKTRIFFCLQLPHFAYDQTWLVARSFPPLSWLVPLLAPVYRRVDRMFVHRADRVVAISQMVRTDCERVYGRDDVAVAGPGIDLPSSEAIDPACVRDRFSIRTEHIMVTAGKIIPKKNFDLFVQVLRLLRRRGVDVTGVIVGDGPLRDRIARLIRSVELGPWCHMTGFVPDHDDVLRYMSGASVYVYLERHVPFGLTPLEASSLGVPVAAFEGGGVEETIVHGENGLKIPSHYGADQIAELVGGLLARPRAERERMGRTGREMAAKWTWDRAYERFRNAIDSPRRQEMRGET